MGYRVEDGILQLGRVDIGARCFVGIHCAVGLDSSMADDCRLDDLSLLADGQHLTAGTSVRGAPARPAQVRVPSAIRSADGRARPDIPRPVMAVLHYVGIHLVGLCVAMAAASSFALLAWAFAAGGLIGAFLAGPLAAIAFACTLAFVLAATRRMVLPRAEPGVYSTHSFFYLRKWFADLLVSASRRLLRPVYTTIYLPPLLRLFGARIGPRAEISTVSQISPELTMIGEESFFADGSMVGGRRVFRGQLQLEPCRIGRRSFVGNNAILPTGSSLGDGCLLGCLSAPPDPPGTTADGTEWLGSPSFALPHRKKVEGFSESVTHRPTPRLYALRLCIDALRIVIPGTIAAWQFVALVAIFAALLPGSPGPLLAALPLLTPALAAVGIVLVAAVKWLLMGRFEPTIRPLWSVYVWLNETVNGAYESIVAPALGPLLGTPFCATVLRMLGCHIGKGCYIETTLFSEFDLVRVGNYAALNAGVVVQNHLFEDRIMKSSTLTIGDNCSIGNMAVVLYDTDMAEAASLAPLSLLMKGETLPSHSRWLGIPTMEAGPDSALLHDDEETPAAGPSEEHARARAVASCTGTT